MTQAITFDSSSDATWKDGWTFIRVFLDNAHVGAIQQKNGRLIRKSGWHVTPENAAMLHALVLQHGTDADHRVLKPESGLPLRQAKACIRNSWDQKSRPGALRRECRQSKANPWSEGLAEALIVAGRTTEQHHKGRESTFEERLETFFDAFCLHASEEQWFKCCAQTDGM